MDTTVLLLHSLADGSSHFDWLLQRPAPAADTGHLITFRTAIRPDLPPPWTIHADRLPDHRHAYLTFEGELSDGRGRVCRLAQGQCLVTQDLPEVLIATVRFPPVSGELHARRVGNSLWELSLRPTSFQGRPNRTSSGTR